MDQMDIECASCAYSITDFSSAVAVECGHGIVHRNCLYFNSECSVCDLKLAADTDIVQFRPREYFGEEQSRKQLVEINKSLQELKILMLDQKQDKAKMDEIIGELNDQLKMKDAKIVELQKEIYELKLESIENLKKEFEDKLGSLQ